MSTADSVNTMNADQPVVPSTTSLTLADKPQSTFRQALHLGRTKVGLVIVGALGLIVLFGPLLAPFGEREYVTTPNTRHYKGTFLGTDYFGQDVLSRFLYGGRSILLIALAATALGVGIGALLGMLAAYLKGRADEVIMRVLDLFLAFPQILLTLVVIAMFSPSALVIILTVGFTTIPRVARVIRGATLGVVERDFVRAAEAIGESRYRVLRSELLPNVSGPLLVETSLRFTYAIGLVASLSFLGFTPELNSANWGLMIQENNVSLSAQPWGVLLPVLAIAAMTVGNGLVADGLSRVVAGIDRGKADV
jgi:peptide/nickel transport system permease protein